MDACLAGLWEELEVLKILEGFGWGRELINPAHVTKPYKWRGVACKAGHPPQQRTGISMTNDAFKKSPRAEDGGNDIGKSAMARLGKAMALALGLTLAACGGGGDDGANAGSGGNGNGSDYGSNGGGASADAGVPGPQGDGGVSNPVGKFDVVRVGSKGGHTDPGKIGALGPNMDKKLLGKGDPAFNVSLTRDVEFVLPGGKSSPLGAATRGIPFNLAELMGSINADRTAIRKNFQKGGEGGDFLWKRNEIALMRDIAQEKAIIDAYDGFFVLGRTRSDIFDKLAGKAKGGAGAAGSTPKGGADAPSEKPIGNTPSLGNLFKLERIIALNPGAEAFEKAIKTQADGALPPYVYSGEIFANVGGDNFSRGTLQLKVDFAGKKVNGDLIKPFTLPVAGSLKEIRKVEFQNISIATGFGNEFIDGKAPGGQGVAKLETSSGEKLDYRYFLAFQGESLQGIQGSLVDNAGKGVAPFRAYKP